MNLNVNKIKTKFIVGLSILNSLISLLCCSFETTKYIDNFILND